MVELLPVPESIELAASERKRARTADENGTAAAAGHAERPTIPGPIERNAISSKYKIKFINN